MFWPVHLCCAGLNKYGLFSQWNLPTLAPAPIAPPPSYAPACNIPTKGLNDFQKENETFPTCKVTKSLISDLLAVSHFSDYSMASIRHYCKDIIHLWPELLWIFRTVFRSPLPSYLLHPPRSCDCLQICSFRTTNPTLATKIVPAKLWDVKGAERRDDQHIHQEPIINKPNENEKNKQNPQAAKHLCSFSVLLLFISLLFQP